MYKSRVLVAVICVILVLSVVLTSLANAETNTVTINPTLAWKTAIDNPIRSAPDVVNSVLYIGSYNGTVFAINTENGKLIWSSTPVGGVNTDDSTPVVVNGVIYISAVGAGTVYALDAATGNVLWKYDTIANPTAPVVVNGVVYVGTFNLGGIFAFKASNGASLWNSTPVNSDWGIPEWIAPHSGVASPPTVVNGIVYFGSDDGMTYAMNATDAHLLWNITSTYGFVYSSPAIADGNVYVTVSEGDQGPGIVYAANAATGAIIWNITTAPIGNEESPVVIDGVVYIGGFNGNVYALKAANGDQIWNYTAGNYVEYKSYPGQYSLTSPTVANGVVYLGSEDGSIYVLDAANGSLLWSYATGNLGIWSSPTVDNGVLYIGSTDGNVYAFSISSTLASPTPVASSLAVPELSTIVIISLLVTGIIAVAFVRLKSASKHKHV